MVFKEELPAPLPFEPEYVKEYLERHHKVMAMVGASDRVQIGLPHDGMIASMMPIKRPAQTGLSI
ncbi:hypothetical protein ACPA9J_15790 [Pseudomonas aeruginosa]